MGNGGSSSGGSSSGTSTVTGTGEGNSWFNWVSTSTSNEGASSASGVNCGCGNLVKDECFFPDKSSCSHFYHCHNVTAYHKRCPANLHWNDATKLCDWPRNVVCNVPSGNGNSAGNGMTGGSGMMHMGRMVHVESEVNSDLPSSDATSSPGNPDNLCPAGFKGLLPDESNCRRYISCSE